MRAHLVEVYLAASFCCLQGGFGAGQAAADDLDFLHALSSIEQVADVFLSRKTRRIMQVKCSLFLYRHRSFLQCMLKLHRRTHPAKRAHSRRSRLPTPAGAKNHPKSNVHRSAKAGTQTRE